MINSVLILLQSSGSTPLSTKYSGVQPRLLESDSLDVSLDDESTVDVLKNDKMVKENIRYKGSDSNMV